MPPPLLIVNPASGARGRSDNLTTVLRRVEAVLGDVVIRYTARRGHAEELARQAAEEGHPLIVAVGGDGTLSEVAAGVLQASQTTAGVPRVNEATPGASGPAVGVIDLGTGGDFRRSLGVGPGYEACLAALAAGRERLIDVGYAQFQGLDGRPVRRYFINVLSAGLGGLVDRYVERMPSWLGGRAGYYLAALLAVAASKERPLLARIHWEGRLREEMIPAYLVAICNGRWFGGGMDVAPMAALDDGRLEVITVTSPSKPYLAKQVSTVYSGRHLEEPTVHHFPCQRLELAIGEPKIERRFLLDLDGDSVGSLPLTVEVQPRRLRVLC